MQLPQAVLPCPPSHDDALPRGKSPPLNFLTMRKRLLAIGPLTEGNPQLSSELNATSLDLLPLRWWRRQFLSTPACWRGLSFNSIMIRRAMRHYDRKSLVMWPALVQSGSKRSDRDLLRVSACSRVCFTSTAYAGRLGSHGKSLLHWRLPHSSTSGSADCPIPVDEEGMVVSTLWVAPHNPKLIYVTPSLQDPQECRSRCHDGWSCSIMPDTWVPSS